MTPAKSRPGCRPAGRSGFFVAGLPLPETLCCESVSGSVHLVYMEPGGAGLSNRLCAVFAAMAGRWSKRFCARKNKALAWPRQPPPAGWHVPCFAADQCRWAADRRSIGPAARTGWPDWPRRRGRQANQGGNKWKLQRILLSSCAKRRKNTTARAAFSVVNRCCAALWM